MQRGGTVHTSFIGPNYSPNTLSVTKVSCSAGHNYYVFYTQCVKLRSLFVFVSVRPDDSIPKPLNGCCVVCRPSDEPVPHPSSATDCLIHYR